MIEQFDLFGPPPELAPAIDVVETMRHVHAIAAACNAPPEPAPVPPPAEPDRLVYTVEPAGFGGTKFGIAWRFGSIRGVVGGLYDTAAEAQDGIDFRLALKAAGIQDARPWMRVPPEPGASPWGTEGTPPCLATR